MRSRPEGITAEAAPPGQARLDFPDALRGIAILLVILKHVGQWAPSGGVLATASDYGQLGVQLFFIVSGFTLALSASKARASTGMDYRSFFIRRWFRIAPMYYLAIVGYLLIRLASGLLHSHPQGVKGMDVYTPSSVLANIFFVNGFCPSAQNNVVPGGWSIGAEFFFYACFPFFIRRSGFAQASAMVGIAGAIAILAHYLGRGDLDATNDSFWYFFPLVHLPCFLAGILLFNNIGTLGRPSTLPVLWTCALVGSATIAYLWPLGLNGNLLFLLVPSLSIAPFALLLVLSSKSGFGNSSVLRAIGERSFSMYLNHFFFVDLFSVLVGRQGPRQVTVFAGYLAVVLSSYLAACITYRFVELPLIAVGRRISKGIAS